MAFAALRATPAGAGRSAAVRRRPSPARAFGDSIGVNTHIGWYDTAGYGDFDPIESRLRELGVRYVRDGLCPTCE